MRLVILLLVGALAGSSAAFTAPGNDLPGELAGRTVGKTQRCVPVEPGRLFSTSESDPHILLYERGKTIWATKLDPDCRFEAGQTVVPDSNAPYYCQGDLVRAGERITLMPFGSLCKIGKFTAYTAK